VDGPQLDDAAVVAAYARWAPVYDPIFGVITGRAIRATLREINALHPGRILEVGVGTGIALPHYKASHRVVGIDISPAMLERAEKRAVRKKLRNVEALAGMDAANLLFQDTSFDVAVAMFVMTVVPEPARVMAEMVRVVRPGGRVVIVSHFSVERGVRAAIERWLSRYSASLGWHPEFDRETLLVNPSLKLLTERSLPPFGLYTLLVFERV